jgi:hypothetical protein
VILRLVAHPWGANPFSPLSASCAEFPAFLLSESLTKNANSILSQRH